MASIVQDIVTQMKAQIAENIPSRGESRYVWSLESNSYKTNRDLFAVRPLGASSVAGTNKTITLDQDFEVVLSTQFQNKGDNDASLQEAIFALHQDAETLYRFAYQRKFNIDRVLVVNSVEIAEADIDNENNIVSVASRFNIKYRTSEN